MSGQVDALGCSTTVAAQIEKRARASTYEEKFVLQPAGDGRRDAAGTGRAREGRQRLRRQNKANGELDKLYQKWLGTKLPAMQAT